MTEALPLGGQIFYENELKGSYLVIRLPGDSPLYLHQVEMLMGGPGPTVLPFYHRERDGFHFCYYEITSRQTLEQVLTRRKITPKELLDILMKITETLLSSSLYLLNYEQFVLNSSYLYVDPNSLEVFLLYLPYPLEQEPPVKALKQLANQLIIFLDPKETMKNQFLHQLMMAIHERQDTVGSFHERLAAIQKDLSDTPQGTPAQGRGFPGFREAREARRGREAWEVAQAAPLAPAIPAQQVRFSQPELSPPPLAAGTMSSPAPVDASGPAASASSRPLLLFLLSQVLLLVASALLWMETRVFVTSTGGMDWASLGAWLGVLVAVEVLLVKKLFQEGGQLRAAVVQELAPFLSGVGKADPTGQRKQKKQGTSNKGGFNKKEKPDQKRSVKQEKEPVWEKKRENRPSISTGPAVSSPPPLMAEEWRTQLLENQEAVPQLIRERGGILEAISLDKPSFVIGKLEDQVDYVLSSQNVSRIHAEIVSREEGYFLKDLNSKNGTFLNGQRIGSNQEYPLQYGDRVRFANLEYEFVAS